MSSRLSRDCLWRQLCVQAEPPQPGHYGKLHQRQAVYGFGNLLRRDNRAYFGLDFVFGTIPNELIPFDYDTFAAYPGEVEAVVTNMDTGKAEYFPVERRDDRFKLLQATCALPFLFPVFDIQGKPCMDGGAADAIPMSGRWRGGASG